MLYGMITSIQYRKFVKLMRQKQWRTSPPTCPTFCMAQMFMIPVCHATVSSIDLTPDWSIFRGDAFRRQFSQAGRLRQHGKGDHAGDAQNGQENIGG